MWRDTFRSSLQMSFVCILLFLPASATNMRSHPCFQLVVRHHGNRCVVFPTILKLQRCLGHAPVPIYYYVHGCTAIIVGVYYSLWHDCSEQPAHSSQDADTLPVNAWGVLSFDVCYIHVRTGALCGSPI